MCSPGVTARGRVLAELAALGPAPADAGRPGGVEAVGLLSQVRDLAAFADQVTGELARLAAALDAVDGAAEAGYSSVAGFLRHGCGRSPGRAGELVAAGRALQRLAATGKALMAGELSFDAAHVICRTAGQIEDDAAALVMEELLLAAARNQRPDLAHRAGQHPGPDGEAPAGGEASSGEQTVPGGEASSGEQTVPGEETAPGGEVPPDQGAAPGESAPSGGQAVLGAVGSLGRWGIPGLDPGALRRLGQELLYRADPDAVEEKQRKRFERRHLSFGFTLDDTGTLSGACGDTLSLEIIKTAVHAFGPPGGTEDSRTAAQRRMDGLTAACQAALDSGTAGTRHGAAPHLSVLVEEQTLAGAEDRCATSGTGTAGATDGCCTQTGTGTTGTRTAGATDGCCAQTSTGTAGTGTAGATDGCCARTGTQTTGTGTAGATHGPTLCPTPGPLGPPPARTGFGAMLTARQVLALACHAELSIIRWSDGIPLDVGRRYRTETPAIRRALEARDQGCRAPGCGMPAAWCTAHHLKPWSQGGTTSLQDTALFCFVHHNYFIHLLGWTITGDPNGTLYFTHPRAGLLSTAPCRAAPTPARRKPCAGGGPPTSAVSASTRFANRSGRDPRCRVSFPRRGRGYAATSRLPR